MSLLNAAMNGGAGGDVSAKTASAATAYSMIRQAINTTSVDGGYKIAEVQGVFPELAPLLDPALNAISSAKISEAFDNATDANSLASSSTFRDILNNNTYLDGFGRASSELFQYYGGYDFGNLTVDAGNTYASSHDGIWFSEDGTRVFFISSVSDTVFDAILSTPFDLTTLTLTGNSLSVAAQEPVPRDVWVKPDGTRLWVIGVNQDRVHQYSLSIPFDLTTATYDGNLNPGLTAPNSVVLSPDGTVLYVMDQANGEIKQFNLTTAWDVTSGVTYFGNVTLGQTSHTMRFTDFGNKLLVSVSVSPNSFIWEYDLASPYTLVGAAVTKTANEFSTGHIGFHVNEEMSHLIQTGGAETRALFVSPNELQAPA